MVPVKCGSTNTLKNLNSILIFGTGAWACLDARAAKLPPHKTARYARAFAGNPDHASPQTSPRTDKNRPIKPNI